MDTDLSHRFQMEKVRREIESCSDLQALKVITLKTLDLLEGQRQWFLDYLKTAPPTA